MAGAPLEDPGPSLFTGLLTRWLLGKVDEECNFGLEVVRDCLSGPSIRKNLLALSP